MLSLQVDTAAGWSASAHRPDHDGLLKKKHINLIEPHMILIPWNTLCGVLFKTESTTNDNSRRKTVEKQKRAIVTEWQKLSRRFIDNSISGVDVSKLLSRMEADTSSIATWLKQPHIILILSRDTCRFNHKNKTQHRY